MPLCCCFGEPEWSDGEVEDDDAVNLSHVGEAAYEVLRKRHHMQHHSLWNVTSGQVVGELHQTPNKLEWDGTKDPDDHHSDYFPIKMAEIMARTERWCDVMSLSPPDGLFMTQMKEALQVICDRAAVQEKKITIRMMFGNIVGMPVNCTAVIRELTKDLPKNPNIRLWVGAWRKGVSWNHAKLIAVDGLYLHTGGHNMWDQHYLQFHPVYDLSLELKGRVAHDGHLFANDQWRFIERIQSTCCGELIDKLPDGLLMATRSRVTVSEYPQGQTTIFPPYYRKKFVPKRPIGAEEVPIISMGRYGSVLRYFRPSDDAFMAMFDSAKTIIRMSLQDLGPIRIPKTSITVPGAVWPKDYLSCFGRAIWERGVDIEIVLSNPISIPGGLGPTEAQYGNGWSCVDVAAEIIKTIRQQFPNAPDDALRKKVAENLRVCFIRRKAGSKWDNGKDTVGLHSKHFIIDDCAAYIGSQNLYICDLAEWGVLIDHKETVQNIMDEYWNIMWKHSYTGTDCNVQAVMDGLDINRDGEKVNPFSAEQRKQQQQGAAMQTGRRSVRDSSLYEADKTTLNDLALEEEKEEEKKEG